MTIKKYTYIDDFFIRKTDEIPAHFSEHINRGFKKKINERLNGKRFICNCN